MRGINWQEEVGNCKFCGSRPGYHNDRYMRCGNKKCNAIMFLEDFNGDFDKLLKAWNNGPHKVS